MREVEPFENQTEIARVDLETRGIAGGKPEGAALEAFVTPSRMQMLLSQ